MGCETKNRRVINSGVPHIIYFQNKVKFCKIPASYVDKTLDSWITVRDGWSIILDGISPLYSLTDALFSYYSLISNSLWISSRQYFLKLICSNCNKVTVYMEPIDIPFSGGNVGQLVCPHCQESWLIYRYDE